MCNYFGMTTVSFCQNKYLLASLMRNYIPKRTSGEPLHTSSKLYDVHVGFVLYYNICGRRKVAVARNRILRLVLLTETYTQPSQAGNCSVKTPFIWADLPRVCKFCIIYVQNLHPAVCFFSACEGNFMCKNQGVFVKHWQCPRRQQSPKKLFLEQMSKSRSQGHWPWSHLKGHH